MITRTIENTLPEIGALTKDQLKAMVLELTDEERRELLGMLKKRKTST